MPGRGHGRGRGGARGRGRGRGRGGSRGRSGGGSRGRGNYRGGQNAEPTEKKEYNIEDDPKALFTGTASTEDHLKAQNTNRKRYAATLAVMVKNKIQVTQNACIRALAMAWARGDKELASAFLNFRSQFGLVEVLRAVNMLDAGRQVRGLERKLKYLQLSGAKVNPKKMGKLKSDIGNLNKLKPPLGSASGAVCKHVASWVRGFTKDELEFFAIHYPKDPWKKLADICHLNPEKDFPFAPWFLPFCFGTGSAPDGSLVQHSQNLSGVNVNDLIQEYDIPYSVVKKFKSKLNEKSKKRIAAYESKLDTVLWWYEDLACEEVDKVISERLSANEPVDLPNGKLLELLLTILLLRNPQIAMSYEKAVEYNGEPEGEVNFFTQLIELAEPRLKSIKLSLESPIVVIGDASGFTKVAIHTSTIIASLLTAICSAKLVFFNNKTRDAPFLPKTVKEMFKLATTTRASWGTAPAASLYPFYANKEVVKTFIMVTELEEDPDGDIEGYRFAALYKKYCEEVYPAHLIIVSFLKGQHAEGKMVRELKGMGFNPKQLRLEESRPDLTKLDDLFAQLSAVTTSSFQEQLAESEEYVKNQGVGKLFESLKDASALGADKDEGEK